jgi:translation initiation factor 3 subunit F
VIGTLLGTRSEDGGEVEVRSAFAVGHSEAEDQVEVDMEYHKQMLALHLKANPREVLVGWYATASELNTFSALIQNFYSSQGDGTWPHPAVHLTVSTEPGKDLETRAYISAPVGVTAERAADSAAFIPVPYELRYGEADKSGLEAIANAKDAEDRSVPVPTDIDVLERAIEEVLAMIDRVSRYVESVIDEEAPASTAMGQFLLNTLALAPKVEPADVERDLYVIPFFLMLNLSNSSVATTTSKMSWSSPIWPIPSAHRWSCPPGSHLPSSLWAPARLALAQPVSKATAGAVVRAVVAATAATSVRTAGSKPRRPAHRKNE